MLRTTAQSSIRMADKNIVGDPAQKVCLSCGKLVSSDDRFCISCGCDLRSAPTPGFSGAVSASAFGGLSAASGQISVPAPYPAPGPLAAPYYRVKKTDDMAIISLICALASFFVLPFIPAVAALILGFMARDRIRKDPAGLEGEGFATAGIIIGLLNVIIVVAVFIVLVILSISGI
jgi:Domain of unknown function (DUF4190)